LEREFSSQDHDQGRIVDPDQEDDDRGDGTVEELVTGKVREVENEQCPGDFKEDGGQLRAGPDVAPAGDMIGEPVPGTGSPGLEV
jgi:hypothetical protein